MYYIEVKLYLSTFLSTAQLVVEPIQKYTNAFSKELGELKKALYIITL